MALINIGIEIPSNNSTNIGGVDVQKLIDAYNALLRAQQEVLESVESRSDLSDMHRRSVSDVVERTIASNTITKHDVFAIVAVAAMSDMDISK